MTGARAEAPLPTARLEDHTLLTGADRFTPDVGAPNVLHVGFVRSASACARLGPIDSSEAQRMPGVVRIFTAADLDIGPICFPAFAAVLPDAVHRTAFANGTVRFAGEIVAAVVADSAAAAIDGAEAVVLDEVPLPCVVDPEAALGDGAPLLFPELHTNEVVHWTAGAGDGAETDGELVTTTLRVVHPRMCAAPLEPNAVLAVPDDSSDRITMYASSQYPHLLRNLTAGFVGMAASDLHVVCPAVGGGFGGKVPCETEYAIVVAIARHLRRPVRWVQTRSENLATMQARGHRFDVTLRARPDGRVVSVDVGAVSDLGAFPGLGVAIMNNTKNMLNGPYRFDSVRYDGRGVATNTAPVSPFRGAGRPEATSVLERSLDVLAATLQLDPIEVRRRNLIGASDFPYTTPTGATYDSGDYEAALDAATALVGYADLRRDQATRRSLGDRRLLGIGVACYVELSAISGFNREYASVEVGPDGRLRLTVGTFAHGQGHRTVFSEIVAREMAIDTDRIDFVQGDTDQVPEGMGSAGSRSAQIGGSAVKVAAEALVEKARRLGAHLLEASVDDMELVRGVGVGVRGVPTSALSWAALAAAALDPRCLPDGMAPRLFADPGFSQADTGTAPFGCHIAVVEVDAETGAVRLVRHVAVDDCGTILNETLAAGQVHGGVAAGAGQALYEEVVYDEEGNLRTSTLAEYGFPSAAELPSIESHHTVSPSPLNPLGAKGLGEGGTTGSLAAVHNAVIDAVAHLGVRHIDIPLTPERVWRAMAAAIASG